MKLQKIGNAAWVLPLQDGRDWPVLGLLAGGKYSLAIDAGYSAAHTAEFYSALAEAGLAKPDFTVLTHWHYDHAFGLHAINGLGMACEATNRVLRAQAEAAKEPDYLEKMAALDPNFLREYPEPGSVRIVPAALEFTDRVTLDLGGLTAELFTCVSPHTDDTVCVYCPEEKLLFLGDANGGDFFNGGYMDKQRLAAFIDTVEALDFDRAVLSHYGVATRAELSSELEAAMKA